MPVRPASNSGNMLGVSGSRCMTTTKAMPVSVSIAEKNSLIAAMPPAEAPNPTIAFKGSPVESARSGIKRVSYFFSRSK